MTRPTREALARLAAALDGALAGRFIDRLWRPEPRMVLMRIPGIKPRRLLIDLERGHPRVILTARWPTTPSAPDRETIALRRHLEGARVEGVAGADERRLVVSFTRRGAALRLTVQLAGRYLNVGLFDADGAEIARLLPGAPASDDGSPPLREGPPPLPDLEGAALLAALDEATWSERDIRSREARRIALRRDASALAARRKRALAAAERDLGRAAAAAEDRHRGELLKSALHRIRRGATAVDVVDWSRPDGATVAIPLDPALDPVANMERYFRRYRKFDRARDRIEARVLEAMAQAEAASALLGELDALAGRADDQALDASEARLRALDHRPRGAGQRGKRRTPDAPALPYRAFVTCDGSQVLVGKGARDNDRLTFQIARGRDLWLHARDAPGSHVVLRVSGRDAPSQQALLDAALLAAWHSKLRGDGAVDVMWTERKHVRKAAGAGPGKVTAAATRTIQVRPDPQRLERLYSTLDSARPGADIRSS